MEVSSRYRLDQLGYLVLVALDTMTYHLFDFYVNGVHYEIPDEDNPSPQVDMANFRLEELGLAAWDRMQMDYDFGATQTFWLELTNTEDMKQSCGKRYPRILEGAGCGILDDVSREELAELMAQIDQNGQTDEPIYDQERSIPWDYRRFDLDGVNGLLKSNIKHVEESYQPFWE